jgi:Dullard-like phosphatase family protein
MQKFELIKNNFILLGNLKYSSNKQLLENINMSRIFIYYLYKFYLGSSFEGCPQNLYNDKNSKLYLHFYSVTLIISLGLMYVITHKIKMTKDYQEKLLILLNLQFKAYLIFCDSMINKINYNINDNDMKDIWINEIIHELNNRKILYTINHISQIKMLSIDSYKLFNEMIRSINSSYNDRSYSKHSEAEIFLYKHFHNKTINYLAQIKINELEEIFDKNIFRIINLRSNFANITSLKSNIIANNQRSKQHQKLNSTSFVFRNENISNNNYNKYEFSIKPVLMLNKNKPKNHQKNNSGINPKQILQNLKVKEPYLDFPPTKEYTLVLDLDETMISFQFTQPQKGIGQMHLRPGLENFLDVIKEYYEIIVFTSGTREYADMVLDVIEHKKKKKLFSGRLYREHTTKIGKKYIKDLSKLGRDLSRTLIVDNLPQSFKFQHENGILISSFYVDENDKKDDRALIELQKILIKIYEDKKDVRLSILKYKEDIIRNVSCLDLRKTFNDD